MSTQSLGLFSHPIFLEHQPTDLQPKHPENRTRLDAVLKSLQNSPFANQLDLTQTRQATIEELSRVHTPDYIARVISLQGQTVELDPETPLSPQSVYAAQLAAGLGIELVERVLRSELPHGFLLARPPGHHATPDQSLGFCVFNSIAIAAHAALAQETQRILILDWDVHHGNGTQKVFEADDRVLFIDLHQDNLFPNPSGPVHDRGIGKGLGYTLNIPLPHSCRDADYLSIFDALITPAAHKFQPELILISAGFDAHESDPLGSMSITTAGFGLLAARVKSLAQELCQGRCVFFLEGGYTPQDLAQNILACIQGYSKNPDFFIPSTAYSDEIPALIQRIYSEAMPLLKAPHTTPKAASKNHLLDSLPDFTDRWEAAQNWIKTGLTAIPQIPADAIPQSLEWTASENPGPASFFNLYAHADWRKFVLATFLADLACYSQTSDQVEFERLLFEMHGFPQGFRIWFAEGLDGKFWPVGYTGWYPISQAAFERFEQNPEKISDRFVAPRALGKAAPYLYLFNYSVAPQFKKTALSKALLLAYQKDLDSIPYQGLCTITVSEEGSRIAQRLGLSCSGQFQNAEHPEFIYTGRKKTSSQIHGRIIESWSESGTVYYELMVGDQRKVVQGTQPALQRGDLIRARLENNVLLELKKVGGPSAGWSVHGDSMRWRKTLGTPSRMARLWQRQAMIGVLRADLVAEGFLEIETPLLVKGTCPDTHIDSIATTGEPGYLVTSTEYQIKRMIVGGVDKAFTLTKNFRQGDRGRYHSSEFTMLEWARGYENLDAIEADAQRFTQAAFQKIAPGQRTLQYADHTIDIMASTWEQLTVREALKRYLQLENLADFSLERLLAAAKKAKLELPENFIQDKHLILSFLLDRIQPNLGTTTPTFLREWPAYMTSSALINPKDPHTAERSELYIAGIEIADGFPFLRDSTVQSAFFDREMQRRREEGKTEVQLDPKYIEALAEGIPPGSGMALGVDRLVMVLVGAKQLSDVQTFSWEEL